MGRVVCSIPFCMVMGVYTLTYGASNVADVVSERYDLGSATQNMMKLFGATGAIHLFGLNLYNQPVATANERARAVMKTYPEATGVRMFRFLWAYGVGGLVNKELNQRARDWTVGQYASQSNSK